MPGARLAAVPLLADLTTLRVGGPCARFVEAASEAELVAAVAEADAAHEPVLVLGGGSNLLVADAGFDGVVVRDVRTATRVEDASACAGASVVVSAGAPWDDVVVRAVAEGWSGIEALSGIPGSTGATPVQNVGAYGQEVGDVLATVRVYDRALRRVRMLAVGDLRLGYRSSLLKRSLVADDDGVTWGPTPRWVVLEVGFQFRLADLSGPVRYAELARALDVELGARAPAAEVREAVLALRRGKGMVLDGADHDTWSAGSFFTNPVLDADAAALLPERAPRFDAGSGRVKTSAAWLISHAGFDRGHGLPGPAALSTKHVLALTNRGGAKTADLVRLAREVRSGVESSFGVVLEPEPVLVGVSL
ncbi:UDP-N-acetylmuramate dehydrogenase [Beutenbergia cavernae DSM 12333]|uniref:UDP-N-acetylenolpyruvoylglucosamine reductase n=1 Tax=Beutenbergia cavernae (strain ATCC BAA-8 / DSM 12333 / CCUG 43141 / JCM 11478 / NBRC 16432 / NCIMB 13614 / HKI 0122) TaxID=471853 RepID=C5C0M6_BEUC1|nr:UDP-N-acetylmuramate dehydrogenase [Beutenbergia cavernae]ACQ81422.1 UDP-N-acetylmuramate dehydrogenase [Beutenbergia cavernae DSM 12333]